MSYLSQTFTPDEIDDYFKTGLTSVASTQKRTLPAFRTTLGGRRIDPATGGSAANLIERRVVPSYKRNAKYNNPQQTAYARKLQQKDDEHMIETYQRLEEGGAPSTCDMSSSASTHTGLMERLEIDSTVASTTNLPEGLTEEEAVSIYKNYNFNKKYDFNLPITRFHAQIIDTIESNQVTVIHGTTGSGKTTQVPQYILDEHAKQGRYCNIIVTQPRRIAAMSVAKRVCDERGWQFGSICGYQVGLDRVTNDDTRLTYCTTGVLLEILVNKQTMRDYTHIILDEVHERDQDSDFCLLLVKMLLRKNSRDVKVILMSATAESDKFAKYFAEAIRDRLENAPIIDIKGRAHDVREFYLEDLTQITDELMLWPELEEHRPGISPEALEIAVQLILRFDDMEAKQKTAGASAVERGSVLVFLPGLAHITQLDDKFRELRKIKQQDGSVKEMDLLTTYKLWILPLHSTVTTAEQRRVFDRPQPGMRKIILATNIAESSITVSDVKYVIDFCLTKNLVQDQETNFTSLQVQWAAKSNCIQRMGRAGRVSDGRVYRFITRKFYKEILPAHGTPEMLRCPLDILVLKAKLLRMGEPKAILGRALDPPNIDDIERTVLSLKEVGALTINMNGIPNQYDGDLTFMGRVMAKVPVSIQLTKLMLLGHAIGLLRDTIIIAACLSNKSFFSTPYRSHFMAYRKRLEWADFSLSDCIAYLYAYKIWETKKTSHYFDNSLIEEKWCREHYIQFRRIRDVEDLAQEIEKRLRREGIETPPIPRGREINSIDHDERELLLKLLFCGAFYPNYFVQHQPDQTEANKQMSGYSHTSAVEIRGIPTNQGVLYRKPIEEMFGCCTIGDATPKIHFEETRAYIEFPRDRRQTKGRVLTAVYLALKMRTVKPLELSLLDNRTALEKVDQMNTQYSFGADLDEGYDSSRQTLQATENKLYQYVQPISKAQQSVFEICISYPIDCGRFWAHYADKKEALAELRHSINEFNGKNLTRLNHANTRSGRYCLARYGLQLGGDDCFYRARIANVLPKNHTRGLKQIEVQVFFLDYGNTESMTPDHLMELDEKHCILPFQAFECELCTIKPSPLRCPTGKWSDAARDRFRKLLLGSHNEEIQVYAEIYSIVHDVWRVKLWNDETLRAERAYTINEQLVHETFADQAEESFLSKKSHKEREEESSWHVSTQSVVSIDGEIPAPLPPSQKQPLLCRELSEVFATRLPTRDDLNKNRNMRVRGNQVKLFGPTSAYEMKFYGLTIVGGYKEAKIERDGVNSVCVDEDPADPHDRMMVAAFVGLNPTNESIIVRDTSIMPSIPGLLAMMALTFCPFAELRCDVKRRRYTGVLCGLGTDPYTGDPAFPDHDMEIDFDFKFTEEDLGNINWVRMGITFAFECGASENIFKMQKETRDKLFKLVTKRRDYVPKYVGSRRYRWNLLQPEVVKIAKLKETVDAEHMPISLHSGIVLEEEQEKLRELIRHSEWLQERAKVPFQEEIMCGFCDNTAVRGHHELRLHLKTMSHQIIESKLQERADRTFDK